VSSILKGGLFRPVGTFPFLLALMTLVAPGLAAQTGEPVRRTVGVMGTLVTVEIWADQGAVARAAADAVVRELERTENLLSTWRDDTELGALNGTPVGVPAAVSAELGGLLSDVSRWSEITGGAFHPAVGALVDAWDLRGEGRVPSPAEIVDALAATGVAGVSFDTKTNAFTRLDGRAWMDAGGFGKGAGLRTVGDTLASYGINRARVDLGGQLLLRGGAPVTIGVAHPARRGEVAATLRVADVSVATSGQSERGVEVDGTRFGHIIDPRTGRPVPPWGSVTVVTGDALVADVLTTALVVLGPDVGLEVVKDLEDVAVLFLDDRRATIEATYNEAMEPYLGDLPGSSFPTSTNTDRQKTR
jgi:thiamine biosynthesis lipoprotein